MNVFKKIIPNLIAISFDRGLVTASYVRNLGKGLKFIDHNLMKINSLEEDRESIIKFIKEFLEKNSIAENKTFLTISDPDIFIEKNLTLPLIPKGEILEAIKWQLKDEVSFDLEDSIIEWRVVSEYTDQPGAKKLNIFSICSQSKRVREFIEILEQCDLTPAIVSVGFLNVSSILEAQDSEDKIKAVLDISGTDTALCVYQKNKLIFVRYIPCSADKFAKSLVGTFASDLGKIDLSYEKACKIVQEFGIPKDSAEILKENISGLQVVSLMRPVLESLVRDARQSFEYFSSAFSLDFPQTIYLVGPGANLKNLDTYLSKELGREVLILDNMSAFKISSADILSFRNKQGTVTRDLSVFLAKSDLFNFLPYEYGLKKVEAVQNSLLKVGVVIITTIMIFSLLTKSSNLRNFQKNLSNLKAHLEMIGEVRDIAKIIKSREDLVDIAQKKKVPVPGLLKVISSIIPYEIVLTSLSVDQEKNTLTLEGLVLVQGRNAEEKIIDFMKRIELSSFF